MADKTIEVKVTESGLSEVKKKAEAVNKELDKVEQPRVVKSATRTGSRAADAALSISGGTTAASGSGDKGLQRGTTGAGGRGGERDFARQAQGLGGLVHLYATFAANIYAVGAAFSALQKAADFERMEKSAAKMSVVLGLNLNSAAKSMVSLTDGALSYADSIEKVNLAGSAGLSSKQITDLTKVAKGASAALGRDMGDSMNRLFKGAIKLEPELLDELGILTKASDAYKVYAASIGKTEDSLTKFEKTQAFTNAIISEGNAKFSSLYDTIEANPYTKLQAKLQDIAKESLVVINTGLRPLVDFLSQNPTALITAVTILVSKLINMAIPSMGDFGVKAKESAEIAKKSFDGLEAKFKDYTSALLKNQTEALNSASTIARSTNDVLEKTNKSIINSNELLAKSFAETNKKASMPIMQNIFGGKSVDNIQSAIDKFSRTLDSAERMNRKLMNTGATPEIRSTAAERITAISALRTQLKSDDFVRTAKDFNDNLKVTETLVADIANLEKKVGVELDAGLKARIKQRLELQSVKAEAVLAARMAIDIGAKFSDIWKLMGTGWKMVSSELVESGAGKLRLFVEKAKFYGIEAGIAFGSFLMKGIAKGMNALMIISVIKDVVIGGIASLLGEAKSLGDLNTSIEESAHSHKLLGERVQEVSKLFFEGNSNIQSYARGMQLAGTTLASTVDNIDKAYENFRKVQIEMQTGAKWTSLVDSIKSMWGGDIASKTAEAQASGLQDTILLAEKLGKGSTLKADLAKALRIPPESINNTKLLNDRLKEVNESGDYLAKEQIKKAIMGISTAAMNSASRVSELSSALDEANKASKIVDTKTEFKNPKYEAIANFTKQTLELAKTDAEEANRLFSQMFADMDPALISELSKIDSSLAAFFSSDLFTQNKMNKLFDTSEAHKDLVSGLSAMKSTIDAFFANPAVLRVQVDPGTGVETLITDKGQVKLLGARLREQIKFIEGSVTDAAIEAQANAMNKATDKQKKSFIEAAKAQRTAAANNMRLAEAESKKLEAGGLTPDEYAATETRMKGFVARGQQAQRTLSVFTEGEGKTATEKVLEDFPKLRGKATDGLSFPKDRLRNEKSTVQTMQQRLKLLEQEKVLNEANLRIADEFLGLGGEQYQQLLLTNFNTNVEIDHQKYLNDLAEAHLKLEESILGIKNDKNTVDKQGNIDSVTKQYEEQVKLIKAQYEVAKDTKRVEFERLAIMAAQRDLQVATSKAAAAAAKRDMSRTFSNFGQAASSAEDEVKFTKQQLSAQMQVVEREGKLAKQRGASVDEISKYNDELAKQYALTVKLYEAEKLATEEALKAFELSSRGGIGNYLTNAAKEFGYQIKDALKNAPSGMAVLMSGVMNSIDNTINKLFEGIQQGTLNMKDLANFARNELSNAFRDAASQVVKNGWKQLMSNLIPGLNDPLKTTIETNLIPALDKLTNALLTKSTEATSGGLGSIPGIKDNTNLAEGQSKGTGWYALNDTNNTTGTQTGDSALEKAGEKQVDAAKDNSNAGKTFLKASDTMFLAGVAMMAFQGKWEQAALMFLAQLATTLTTMAATGGQSGGGIFGTIFKGIVGAFTGSAGGEVLGPVVNENAKGGIMTEYGPLRLEKYARGGIATRPQLALYGEGSTNEAYVPLPDNRTIPVTLNGAGGSTVTVGDTNITVNVDSNGNAQVDTTANSEMAKSLSMAIKRTVQEELMNQVRPGGMFYGKR